jgi:hypothetical protein
MYQAQQRGHGAINRSDTGGPCLERFQPGAQLGHVARQLKRPQLGKQHL